MTFLWIRLEQQLRGNLFSVLPKTQFNFTSEIIIFFILHASLEEAIEFFVEVVVGFFSCNFATKFHIVGQLKEKNKHVQILYTSKEFLFFFSS